MTDKHRMDIAMICDDDYVMPTCVALHSLIRRKDPHTDLHIHVITSNISTTNQSRLNAFDSDDVHIDIIARDADALFVNYHEFKEGAMCVASLAALFKFLLPDLLNELDKVLYLDGDIIVRKALDELYATDISDFYAAAVIDSGRLYFPTPWNKRYPAYFNSGVMLMNLKRLREEKVPELLLKTKMELEDTSLMDQNVFNIVFENKVLFLPNRYNLMAVNLTRTKKGWNIEDVNKLYHSSYRNKNELYKDAVIVHYSSKDKPWKDGDNALSDLWIDEYLETPNIGHELYETEEERKPLCIVTDLSIDGLSGQEGNYEVLRFRKNGSSLEKILQSAKGDCFWFLEHDISIKNGAWKTIHDKMIRNGLDALLFEEEHEGFSQVYPKVYEGQELFELLQRNEEKMPGFDRCVISRKLLEAYLKDHELLKEDIIWKAQRIKNHNEALYVKQASFKSLFRDIIGKGK